MDGGATTATTLLGDYLGNSGDHDNNNSNNIIKNGSIEASEMVEVEIQTSPTNIKEPVQLKFSIPDSFQERLNRKNDQIGQLMADANKLENDLKSRKLQISQLTAQLSQATQERDVYKIDVDSLQVKLDEVERNLNQKSLLLQDAIDDAIAKENTIQQMKSKLTGLDAKMAAMQSNDDIFMEKERVIRELSQLTNELRRQLQDKETQLEREVRQNRVNNIGNLPAASNWPSSQSYYTLTVDPMQENINNQRSKSPFASSSSLNGQDWFNNLTKQAERYVADFNLDNVTRVLKQYRRTFSTIISNPKSLSTRKLLRIGVTFYLLLIHIVLIIYIF